MNHADVSSPPLLASTVLSALQLMTLAAAVDRIIPPDSESPGGAEGGSLAGAIRQGGRSIVEIDEMLCAIRASDTFQRRARDLSGQRGGRPSSDAFRVLSAVARLKANAGSGDPKAEAELKLVRTFLADD